VSTDVTHLQHRRKTLPNFIKSFHAVKFLLRLLFPAVSRFLTACLAAGSFIILNYTIQWAQKRREQLSVWEIEGRVLRLALKRAKSLLPSAGQETGTYRIRKEITQSVALA
jgi:hypothetical protein